MLAGDAGRLVTLVTHLTPGSASVLGILEAAVCAGAAGLGGGGGGDGGGGAAAACGLDGAAAEAAAAAADPTSTVHTGLPASAESPHDVQ